MRSRKPSSSGRGTQAESSGGAVHPLLLMKPLGITLAELRQDRLLDELVAQGLDPLHFQAVFDCGDTTALNYLRLLGSSRSLCG